MQISIRLSFSLISLFCSSPLFSQEKLGIANSNYSSTNAIYLNPVFSVDSRTFFQLNLIGLNAYAYTNQMYLPDFSIAHAAAGYNQEPVVLTDKRKKFLYGNFSVDGPAFVVSQGRIGFGLFTRGRAEIDIRRVPYELTNIFLQQKISSEPPAEAELNLRNVKMSTMAWAEYGLNFGIMAKKRNGLLITVGGNIKYLTGIQLFYANLARFNGFMKDTLIDIKDLRGRVRISNPGWATGKGYGADLGVSYRRALKSDTEYEGYYVNSTRSDCKQLDYLFKASLSLLDLGYIKFDGQTLKGEVEGSLYVPNYNDAGPADSLILANFDTSMERNKIITATLPTGLSAQLDMNMSHHIYLNVTIIKNLIPAAFTGVQRANLLSITPRYERKQFEAALPLTFHRFIYPQLGFAFRFRTFVLGFDNVFPLFMAKNTYGLNVYFSLGISLFRGPACKVRYPRKKKEKKRTFVTSDCPKFGKKKRFIIF